MITPRQAFLTLEYDGTDISSDIRKDVENFTYTDSGSDSSDSLSIKVNAMDHKWINSWMPDKEAVLHPTLCTTNWIVQGDRTVLDCGTLVVDDLSFSACPDVLTIGAVARPNGTSFHEKNREQVWKNTSIKRIAETIAGRYGLECKMDAEDVSVALKEQDDNDSSFLQKICSTYGLILKTYRNKIWIFDREKYKKKDSVATVKPIDIVPGSLSWNTTLAGTYTGGEFTYSNQKKKVNIKVTIGTADRMLKLNQYASSEADAKRQLQAAIVKIKVNGASKDFIVVQQGNPNTSTYDSSCNGTWLLMKDIYTTSTFGNNNSYKDSSIHTYLNGTFYNLIDSNIRAAIKQVKIPYQNGTGSGGSLATGSNGLSTKVFLLSGYEVGWTTSDNGYFPKDGVRLAYFGNSSSGNSKRIAYNGSSAAIWWLRSPYASNYYGVWGVNTDGSNYNYWYDNSYGVRPAFILPSTLVVSDDGTVSVNTAPTVSTDGAALGRKNAAFAWKYTVRDADGDTLTVTEKLDGKTAKTRTGVASGTALTFEQTASAAGFQKILNGNHTITVEVSDGKETVSTSATFTKAVHAASVTLAEPLAVEGDITVAVLQVTGSIPDDAKFKAEVTNNALDSSPVWQDATTEVKKGVNIVFENKTATNGAAFNFRVSVERGESGEGGYIEAVSGAFQ